MDRINLAELEDFETTFLDGSVRLPEGTRRPCQWAGEDEILPDDQFFGRWRGWLEANSQIVHFDFRDYAPILPPPGCGPAAGEDAPLTGDAMTEDPPVD